MDIYVTKPSNVAIVAGKPLRLECGTAHVSTIHWSFQAFSPKADRPTILIYNGEAIRSKTFAGDFSVDSSNGENRDLVANEAKLEHAGVYDCFLVISTTPSTVSQTPSFVNQRHSSKSQVI